MVENVAVDVSPGDLARQPGLPAESRRARWRAWLLTSSGRSWHDSRAGRALHFGIHLLLLSMLLAVSVSLVTSLLPPRTPPGQRIVNSASVTQPVSVEPIIAAHLFGTATPPEIQTSTPSLNPGDITLLGIVYAVDPARSRAILSTHGQTTVVAIGDTLGAGEKVAAIESRRVLLNQNGRSIPLELSFVSGNAASSSPMLAQDATAQPQNAMPALSESDNSVTSSSAPTLRAVNIPVSASPLDQMRALRAQLVRGHPQRYLDRSRLVRKSTSSPTD